jgi:protein-S-isoprenylcysteine O-methyltransferase Ste14
MFMKTVIVRLAGASLLALIAVGTTFLAESFQIALGVIVTLSSLSLLLIARRELGTSFSLTPRAKALVTTGFYSRIQHPMYFFLDLTLLGLIITFDEPVLLLFWGLIVVIQSLQARREEKILADTFGAEYETYKIRAWF